MTKATPKALPHVLIFPGLQGLEERFLGLIEPKLAAALSQKNGERVQQLSGMLLGIQCYGTVEKLYNTARMAPLQVSSLYSCVTHLVVACCDVD